ncbi:hypothetical protein UFOVP813_21 [uncultured Caudovirales phage]|uniref:Uncharacterized protein n=1 Tax=uncultured Caudovirales phage TaxID=2100421 RepID=A0A6J5NWP3_9CAUD|nr:hypothetical protein UFOVP813_21 [uncultured Caudovirales phage]
MKTSLIALVALSLGYVAGISRESARRDSLKSRVEALTISVEDEAARRWIEKDEREQAKLKASR